MIRKPLQTKLSQLRTAVRELRRIYRRRWLDAAAHRKSERLQTRVIKIHTAIFQQSTFQDVTWKLTSHSRAATSWRFKAELSLSWPRKGDAIALREAHKIVRSLTTTMELYPEKDVTVKSTSVGLVVEIRVRAVLKRFVVKHRVKVDPTPIVDSCMRSIRMHVADLSEAKAIAKRLNRLSK